jgi:hypothetical protein
MGYSNSGAYSARYSVGLPSGERILGSEIWLIVMILLEGNATSVKEAATSRQIADIQGRSQLENEQAIPDLLGILS